MKLTAETVEVKTLPQKLMCWGDGKLLTTLYTTGPLTKDLASSGLLGARTSYGGKFVGIRVWEGTIERAFDNGNEDYHAEGGWRYANSDEVLAAQLDINPWLESTE